MSNHPPVFESVHEEFRSRIKSYLAHMVGETDAEDLTQEVFLRVNQALAGFRGESRISTWIYRIATNAAIDKLRKYSFRVKEQPIAADSLDEIDDLEPLMGEKPLSPEEKVFSNERYDCFIEFVKRLPLSYRAVLALSELEAMKDQEIAEILDLSLETVKIRLHRGRIRLLQELKQNCAAEDWL